MKKLVVKIDICGSKDWCDHNHLKHDDPRKFLATKLLDTYKDIYPESEKDFPSGSFYKLEGDSIYLILDKPTVGIRASIEFSRTWSGMMPALPDCRIVMDYGELSDIKTSGKIEILGEPLENLSKIEKSFREGEIGLTQSVADNCDETVVQFLARGDVQVSQERKVSLLLANYENPRLVEDSAIVHALFIAEPKAKEVRIKSFEALILELCYKAKKALSIHEINALLTARDCPTINRTILLEVAKTSQYLQIDDNECAKMADGVDGRIDTVRNAFENARKQAYDKVVTDLQSKVGLDRKIIQEKLDLYRLTEEYLCAVFLEVRMMANYFRSTGSVFDRLSSSSEFDYIITKYINKAIGDSLEKFVFFKKSFLESLRELSFQNNAYVAAIFHNVLILYYLNRNSKYANAQLSDIRGKELFLDTNALYALFCRGSNYYDMMTYTLTRLRTLDAKTKVFDVSVREYNESLETAYRGFSYHKGSGFISGSYSPWIWEEFEKHREVYNNNFEYCVKLYKIPQKRSGSDDIDSKLAKQELEAKDISLEVLKPICTREQLGDLYSLVYDAKRKYDPNTDLYMPKGSAAGYESRVLHDANCLYALKTEGGNPIKAKKLFVTCDYTLAKIRKRRPGQFDFLVTATELFEFMLPYLFLGDTLIAKPVELPSFLLAASISAELSRTRDLESLVGEHLKKSESIPQNYFLLGEIANTERWQQVKSKFQQFEDRQLDDDTLADYGKELFELFAQYRRKVSESLSSSIVQDTLKRTQAQLDQVTKRATEAESELALLKGKRLKTEKYRAKQRQKAGKKPDKPGENETNQ